MGNKGGISIRLFNVELRFDGRAPLGFLLLAAALAAAVYFFLDTDLAPALVLGVGGGLLHFFALITHHLAHAAAAARTGFPMEAVEIGHFLVLGTSVYPQDEPPLPGRIHIQRALGGPIGSLALALLAGFAGLALAAGSLTRWLALWLAADSFVVFFLGVFLPLGFTDMSTILDWWGK